MLYWIEMDIIEVGLIIRLVSYDMIPESVLPNAANGPCSLAKVHRKRLLKALRKYRCVAVSRFYHKMYVVWQCHPGVNFTLGSIRGKIERFLDEVGMVSQYRAAVVGYARNEIDLILGIIAAKS